jgi:hypothetical protein
MSSATLARTRMQVVHSRRAIKPVPYMLIYCLMSLFAPWRVNHVRSTWLTSE